MAEPPPSASQILVALTGTGCQFLRVGLFANDITPNTATKMEDLVEPNFVGYDKVTGAKWSDPTTEAPEQTVTKSPTFRFGAAVGAAASGRLYGHFVSLKTPIMSAEVLVAARRFAVPVELAGAGSSFGLTLQLSAARTPDPAKNDLSLVLEHRLHAGGHQLSAERRNYLRRCKDLIGYIGKRDSRSIEKADTKGQRYAPFFADALTDESARIVLSRCEELLGGESRMIGDY